jgi:hypothetical protein
MLNRRKLDVEADRRTQTHARKGTAGADVEFEMRQKYLEKIVENCSRITDALKLLISRCRCRQAEAPAPPWDISGRSGLNRRRRRLRNNRNNN